MDEITLNNYQSEALKTKTSPPSETSTTIALLGLAGETGGLLSEYKKCLRDKVAHQLFEQKVKEELGDILWYLSDTASNFDFNLEEIAKLNLKKCRDRWMNKAIDQQPGLNLVESFDHNFPPEEQLPRQMIIELRENNPEDKEVTLLVDGQQVGSILTDNAHSDDGYRFHDIFHFSCMGVLGWSPNMRGLMKKKRKSNPKVDEVEDGGRAKVIEEGIAAFVYTYAHDHNWLEGMKSIDYDVLQAITRMVKHLEVAVCSHGDWEKAIIRAYDLWRVARASRQIKFKVDLDAKDLFLME